MNNILVALTFTIFFSFAAQAQQAKPQLLKEPASWPFERFALPPVFAPNFPFKGAEELRFSPGMFNKDSTDYFTYAFAAQLDSTTSISQDNIRNYLLDYFKGLCSSTANNRKLVVDTSKISVSIEKKKDTLDSEIIYNAFPTLLSVVCNYGYYFSMAFTTLKFCYRFNII
ncbi:MAG: hypothetical protein M3Z92_03050 [Bacteroidota bacterium]|nr:hypothetical protein [Bacteroidota bacterium]